MARKQVGLWRGGKLVPFWENVLYNVLRSYIELLSKLVVFFFLIFWNGFKLAKLGCGVIASKIMSSQKLSKCNPTTTTIMSQLSLPSKKSTRKSNKVSRRRISFSRRGVREAGSRCNGIRRGWNLWNKSSPCLFKSVSVRIGTKVATRLLLQSMMAGSSTIVLK